MLGYLSTNNSKISSAGLHKIDYLVGEFNVLVYLYQSDFWTKVGTGASSISTSDKLITEKIQIMKGGELISMNNTFVYELSEEYKMMALDLNLGTMDIYKGKIQDEKLIFYNSDAVARPVNTANYVFKLIYDQISEKENQVIIGRSKDEGKTWIPYIKSLYKRK